MAYQDIPLPADPKNISQGDIRENFLQIDTLVSTDHEDFSAAAGTIGKHKKVTLTQQAGDPATLAGEIALYTKDVGGAEALFLKSGVAGTVVDFTTATKAASGACTLPSGISFRWGTGTVAVDSANSGYIDFSTPFATAVYGIQITAYGGVVGAAQDYVLNAENLGTVRFSASRNGSFTGHQASFYYFAVGV